MGDKKGPRRSRGKLDSDSDNPVRTESVTMNGNDVPGASDENDLSLVCVVRFDQFDAVFAGDLSGARASRYRDIETSVAPPVGQVEVYKVNHHGSRHSSNGNWLREVASKLEMVSCKQNNRSGHRREQVIERLHAAGAVMYWTSAGGRAAPVAGKDKVGGNIVVEVMPNATTFKGETRRGLGWQLRSLESGSHDRFVGVCVEWPMVGRPQPRVVSKISLHNLRNVTALPPDRELYLGVQSAPVSRAPPA